MRLAKILLICFVHIPSALIGQGGPGALYPSFGEFGVAVTTESLTKFENILPLANGKFLVTDHELAVHYYPNGATESYTFSKFWRYNANGTLDQTYYGSGKKEFWSSDIHHQYFTSFAVLTDGRIVAIEGVQVLGSAVFPLNRIWIFNADGTGGAILAELFVAGYFSVNLNAITVDKNNRIVVTGYVRGLTASDKNKTYIARLLSDGNFDETFNNVGFRVLVENSSYNYSGEKVFTDAGNNIVIVEEGYYGTANGFYISKYLEDGRMETAFGNVNATAEVRSLVTDGSSKIIFSAGSNIKRLNSNGTADVTFQSPGFSVRKLIAQPDNKIIAIGSGSSNGHSAIKVGRFGTTGTLDPVFGTNGIVTTDLNFASGAHDAIYVNRRLYLSGWVAPAFSFGTLAAYDASDVRMTCPTTQNPYSVDAGKCYATISGINAVMSSSTLWANVQHILEYNGSTVQGEGGVSGKQFQLGTTHVTYSYTDITTQSCSFDVTVTDQDPPVAKCKNVTVQLDATGNGTLTAAQVNDGSTDGCGIQSMSLSKTSFTCNDASPQTVTLTVTDIHGNFSTCTSTVTIEDSVPPDAKCKSVTIYLDATGNGSITTAQINDASTDACGIKSYSLDKTTFNCSNKGSNTVTMTVTDNHDNVAMCTATVIVLDTLPPEISSVMPTPAAIWPSDRKMKNVLVATTSADNCITHSCRITGVTIKAGEFSNDNVGPDWEITGPNTVKLRAEIPKKAAKRIYTVTVTCTDESGNLSSSSTDVIVAHNITSPSSGTTVKVGSTVNLAGEFWDTSDKKHTAKWWIDDKSINGMVSESSGTSNGIVTGSYKLANPGVYKIRMNVTDQFGHTTYANTNEHLDAIVVVYDPNGGFTYGGGYFNSPAGALISDQTSTGEASYGFAMNYFKNSTNPKGEAQFEFKAGEFEFNALNFDYLVISNSMAQFKGTGKIIGGQSGVGFTMTVVDGQFDGTGIDKIRMKIYNKNNGTIIYDNQPGASDAALPTQAVGANSIIVIGGTNSGLTSANKMQSTEMEATAPKVSDELDVIVYPNPAGNYFNLTLKSNDTKEKIVLQVFDQYGRSIEVRNNISTGSTVRVGDLYRSGVYYVRVKQGKLQKQLKLIKLN